MSARRCALAGVLAIRLAAAPASTPAPPTPLFRDVAADAGLRFTHQNGAAGRFHLPEIMGSGGALFDYDGDGDLDALLLQGRALDAGAGTTGAGGHRLFRNDLIAGGRDGGALRFTDVTERAGFAAGDYGMGAATGDYDGDGDVDLYITAFGRNRLYRNDGGGTFSDVTAAAGRGLDDPRWSTSASFGDLDADGDLDLFVANYVDFTVANSKVCHDPLGVRDYCGPRQFRPVPDRLFRNNGDGTFTDVTEASGISRAFGPGLGAVIADFTGDDRPDIYVANDGAANQLWMNRGGLAFEDRALLAGVALNADGGPEGSMGIAAGDPDNDGDLDLFVTNITGESHAYYENLGRGRFEDRRVPARIGALTRPYTGFGTDWFDADRDGLLDLFTANGAVTVIEALKADPFPFRQPNQLLRNTGSGRFEDVTGRAGAGLAASDVSRGAAFGDVDNDGDVDILVTTCGGDVRLLRNDTASDAAWVQLRLAGTRDNPQGLGATVAVRLDDGHVLWRRARADGSYLSASDPRVHIGLGAARSVVEVAVVWPGGRRESWRGLRVGETVTLRQGSGPGVR